MKFNFNSLTFRITVAFILIGLFPTIVLTTQLVKNRHEAIDKDERIFQVFATELIGSINEILHERYLDLIHLKSYSEIQDFELWDKHKDSIDTLFNNYTQSHDDYVILQLVDKNGQLIASSDSIHGGSKLDLNLLYKKNYINEEWFKDVLNKKFTESSVLKGVAMVEPKRDTFLGNQLGNADLITMGLGTPIYDKSGQFQGVLYSVLNFAIIEELFIKKYQLMSQIASKDIEMTLLDKTGTVLIDYDPFLHKENLSVPHDFDNVIFKLNLVKSNVSAAVALTEGKSGHMESFHFRKKIWQSVGFATSAPDEVLPNLHWGVLIRSSEIGIPSYIIAFWIFIPIVVSTVGYFLAKKLAKPILVISKHLQKVSRGDLSNTLELKIKGELGNLVDSTNETTNQLKIIIGNLKNNIVKIMYLRITLKMYKI